MIGFESLWVKRSGPKGLSLGFRAKGFGAIGIESLGWDQPGCPDKSSFDTCHRTGSAGLPDLRGVLNNSVTIDLRKSA